MSEKLEELEDFLEEFVEEIYEKEFPKERVKEIALKALGNAPFITPRMFSAVVRVIEMQAKSDIKSQALLLATKITDEIDDP